MKKTSIPCPSPLTQLYRQEVGDYPKFFKMDVLSRLGFLLTERLVGTDENRFQPREDRAVLVFSREGSIANDRHYDVPHGFHIVVIAHCIRCRNIFRVLRSVFASAHHLPILRKIR
jgi:hypothetical protein